MTIPEKAAAFMEQIAADESHGYDQNSRWGPDYDCSSLIITVYKQAGVPLTCTYTGNMRSDMLNHGFVIPVNVNLSTGAGLQRGDVLLNERSHTAMYVGNGKLCHASGNEYGKATGGKTGDQTGKEISITGYFNFPWDYCLRYVKKDEAKPDKDDKPSGDRAYVVKDGDSLWKIAQAQLGDPWRYPEIMKANGLTTEMIFPGQVLIIPNGKPQEPDAPKLIKVTAEVEPETWELLQIMAKGNFKATDERAIGKVLDLLLEDAR